MGKQKRVFHGGDSNKYISCQMVAAILRSESSLPLHVITNKMSSIRSQKRPHTDA